jgi:hypothetical protein
VLYKFAQAYGKLIKGHCEIQAQELAQEIRTAGTKTTCKKGILPSHREEGLENDPNQLFQS